MIVLRIITESLKLAIAELRSNKLRSFLSILGISIGIFCIIAVQSAVDSLQASIESGLGELGGDVVMVDILPWDEDPETNYWKYLRRPAPSYDDYEYLDEKLESASSCAYAIYLSGKTIKYKSSSVEGALLMGTTLDFPEVQTIDLEKGRLFTQREFLTAENKVIMGAVIAKELFGLEEPLGKYVRMYGQQFQVIGVLKEEGDNPFNFISYDEATWINYNTAKKFVNTKGTDRFSVGKILYAKLEEGYTMEALKDEITGLLRTRRRLNPSEDNNFSLNELSMLSKIIDGIFGAINLAGLFIGIFALIVGMISVANIMFVSVKERTNIIGVKKALGAKNYFILLEFLIESTILCILGGLAGLILVYGVMKLISAVLPIQLWMSPGNVILGLTFSISVGIIAGLLPALQASRMDPVEAIRK